MCRHVSFRILCAALLVALLPTSLLAATFSVALRASGQEQGPIEQREYSDHFPNLDVEAGFFNQSRCTDFTAGQACITDPGCEIDYSRTYVTPTGKNGAGFGQGGAGYGAVVNQLNTAGGEATYKLDADKKCLTTTVRVCAEFLKTGGHYKGYHVIYAKCSKPQPWSQVQTKGPFTIIPATPPKYTQITEYTGPIGSGTGSSPVVSLYSATVLNLNPAGEPLQTGMFAGNPGQTAANGPQFWVKDSGDNDLLPTALEVTQGIQNLANEMPLVERRRTAVRGYLKSTKLNVGGVQAGLRGFRNGAELPGSPLAPESILQGSTTGGSRIATEDAFLFWLPVDWRQGTVTLRLEIDPNHLVPETNKGNNTLERVVVFASASPMEVTSVPLHLHVGGTAQGTVHEFRSTDSRFWPILKNLYRYHPVSEVLYRDCGLDPVKPVGHDLFHREWDLTTGLDQALMLARVMWKRAFTDCGSSNQFWIGLVDPDVSTATSSGSTLGIGIPFGRASWVKMNPLTWPSWSVAGGATMAHELGHNRGLSHVNCAGTEGFPLWPFYPYPAPNCRLAGPFADGYFGFDVYSDLWNYAPPTVISNDPLALWPHRAFPLMGYKDPVWVNPTAYCWMLLGQGILCNPFTKKEAVGTVGFTDLAVAEPASFTGEERRTGVSRQLLVGGVLNSATGAVAELEVRRVIDPGANALLAHSNDPRPAGDPVGGETLTLIEVDRGGAELRRQDFTAGALENLGDFRVFLEALPVESGVAGVRLLRGTTLLAERKASASPPEVHLLSPQSGGLKPGTLVQWQAGDLDGDALTFSVSYSQNGGSTWRELASDLRGASYRLPDRLAGSSAVRLRVTAYDGFWTTSDTSAGTFVVAGNRPLVTILRADPSFVREGQTVLLSGTATDLDQGPIADPSRFRWTSDLDGPLGTGTELTTRNLSRGIHRINLTVTDDDGLRGAAVIILYVGIDPPRGWTVWLNFDGPGGVGDFETLETAVRQRGVCPEPTAIQCRATDGRDWTATGQVYTCDRQTGGVCRNDQQRRGEDCLDYEVRYLCPSQGGASAAVAGF
jgi:hypothetical protein